MALTEAQRKSRVALFVGDCDNAGNPIDDGTGIIATNIDLIWDTWSGITSLYIRELYARRDAITMVLARLALTSDTAIGRDLGLSVNKSDRAKAYQKMLDDTNKLLAAAGLSSSVSSTDSNIGTITRETPVTADEQPQFLVDLR